MRYAHGAGSRERDEGLKNVAAAHDLNAAGVLADAGLIQQVIHDC